MDKSGSGIVLGLVSRSHVLNHKDLELHNKHRQHAVTQHIENIRLFVFSFYT